MSGPRRTIVVAALMGLACLMQGCGTSSHYWPEQSEINVPRTAPPPNCTTTQNPDGTVNTVCSQ